MKVLDTKGGFKVNNRLDVLLDQRDPYFPPPPRLAHTHIINTPTLKAVVNYFKCIPLSEKTGGKKGPTVSRRSCFFFFCCCRRGGSSAGEAKGNSNPTKAQKAEAKKRLGLSDLNSEDCCRGNRL